MSTSSVNFPIDTTLVTMEQRRDFELLRLAFFALKLQKLEQYHVAHPEQDGIQQYVFHRNLLFHVIFQQVVSLSRYDAQEQALQIIKLCNKNHPRSSVTSMFI